MPWKCDNSRLRAQKAWPLFQLGNGKAEIAPSLEARCWVPWLERLPVMLTCGQVMEVHRSGSLRPLRQIYHLHGPDGRAVFVKCYRQSADDTLPSPDGTAEGNSPRSAFLSNRQLWDDALPVPEPLVFIEHAPDLPGMRSCVITAMLEGYETLADFAFEHLHRHPALPEVRNRWVRDVIAAVARLHLAGYSHGDLHHQNMMIRSQPGAGVPVCITDFDDCRIVGSFAGDSQLRDLASLGASLCGVIPESIQACGLACYFKLLALPDEKRTSCLKTLEQEYQSILTRYQASFDLVEASSFRDAISALSK